RSLPGSALQFECNGFRRLQPGMGLTRTWSLDGDGSMIFDEQLSGFGLVDIESRVFLGEGEWGALRESPESGQCQMEWSGGAGKRARIVVHVPRGTTIALERASFTPEYGVEKPTYAMVLRVRVQLPLQWTLRCEFNVQEKKGTFEALATCVA